MTFLQILVLILLTLPLLECSPRKQDQQSRVFVSENFQGNHLSDYTTDLLKLWKPFLENQLTAEHYEVDNSVWDITLDSLPGTELYFQIREMRSPIIAEILNIQMLDSTTFSIKTAFYESTIKDGDEFMSLNFINETLFKKMGSSFKAQSYLMNYTKNWLSDTVKNIIYHYPTVHKFDLQKAQTMADYCDSLSDIFAVDVPKLDYFIFENSQKTFTALGFFYNRHMFNTNQVFGRADGNKNYVYAGNGSEIFPHEIVHLYTNNYYTTLHPYFDEGLAEHFDFSIDSEKDKHRRIFAEYLSDKPEIDLSNFLELADDLNHGISYKYDLSCLVVEKIHSKRGNNGIEAILTAGSTDEAFYSTIEEQLQMDRQSLGDSIRSWVKNY